MNNVRDLCGHYQVSGFYYHSPALVAVRYRSAFLWYGWRGNGFKFVTSTDERLGAEFRRL